MSGNRESSLLSISGLEVKFGEQHAVAGVDLDIFPGETLAIVGESGSGKSTLARTVVGLARPSRGQIRFRGQDLATTSSRQLRSIRREIQMIFQDPYSSLDPRFRLRAIIGEPLDIFGYPRKERDARVEELAELVGLRADQLDRYPHEFSGGQRQRIGIARAMALEPSLIICDEPVSALDVSIQSQIINLLLDLQEKTGVAYLFISHDLGVVEFLADRVGVMQRGKVVELGDTAQIFENPQHPYTRTLLASSLSVEPPASAG